MNSKNKKDFLQEIEYTSAVCELLQVGSDREMAI